MLPDASENTSPEPSVECTTRGLTLVELMVVIGIITLLAALLLPATMKARAAGQQTTCVSNLRQLGLAISMYREDWDGRLPPFFAAGAIQPYAGSWQVFLCPADPYVSILNIAPGDIRYTQATHHSSYSLQFSSGPPFPSGQDAVYWPAMAKGGSDFGLAWDSNHGAGTLFRLLVLRMDGRVELLVKSTYFDMLTD